MGATSDSTSPRRNQSRRAAWTAAVALAAAVLAPAVVDTGTELDPTSDQARAVLAGNDPVPQTSDGDGGELARVTRPWLNRAVTYSVTREQIAPGVRFTQWDTVDSRGPVRFHLLAVDLSVKGVSLDYAAPAKVARTVAISTIFKRDKAVAGVNGDFFDIGDTSAPLGTGKDRQRGLLHGRAYGWNSTFYIDSDGVPQVGTLPVTVTSPQLPGLTIRNLNSAFVYPNSVGLWTKAWGKAHGVSMTDGQSRDLRVVRIRNKKVSWIGKTVPRKGTLKTRLLIGRGKTGVAALSKLKVGDPISFRTTLQGRPQMAITGQSLLIDDGVRVATEDLYMHPRTAIGIDRDNNEVLMLVVDGRQSFSRGLTLVELANALIELGADEAVNLDGGGSSSMFLHPVGKSARLANSPSDGRERMVANGVEVLAPRNAS